jgi:hypothetical protein
MTLQVSRNPKLRVGLVLHSSRAPAWLHRTIETVRASSYAEISLVVYDGDSVPRPDSLEHVAYRIYRWNENARSLGEGPNARTVVGIDEPLKGVPSIKLREDGSIEKIRAAGLDVLLYLGEANPDPRLLKLAKQGMWRYRHGDLPARYDSPAGFWEVFLAEPVTATAVHAITGDGTTERILAKTYSSTDPMLVRKSMNPLLWKAVSMLPRQLEELHRIGHEAFAAKVNSDATPEVQVRRDAKTRFPTNSELLPAFTRHMGRYFKRKFENFFYIHQWMLFFDFEEMSPDGGKKLVLSRFKPITPPKDRFWADPCVVLRDGKYHVFMEEYPFDTRRAHISAMTIDENGQHSDPKQVLARPYHLSYPFLFRWNSEDYMIPETIGNRAIELYRCEEFPGRWALDRVLIEGIRAADVTLIEHGGRWWLFASVIENEGASTWDELFLYSADTPIGSEWKPHPKNPIVSDVRRARPAGRVFRSGGELYRPGQDCSKGYGSSIRIHRILKMTETEYQEEEVSRLEPGWDSDLVGIHTLSRDGKLTVIDGNKRRNRYFD